MDIKKIIGSIELFEGLSTSEIDAIIAICQTRRFRRGDLLTVEGEVGNELFIVMDGIVEVIVEGKKSNPQVLVNLGTGQLIGEMSLVDRGLRSATVRAIHDPTIVQVIQHQDFHQLCNKNNHIGYVVMRNMAADLSFKLRHRHLSDLKG
jgi:CRP-like cAMP-binding protein